MFDQKQFLIEFYDSVGGSFDRLREDQLPNCSGSDLDTLRNKGLIDLYVGPNYDWYSLTQSVLEYVEDVKYKMEQERRTKDDKRDLKRTNYVIIFLALATLIATIFFGFFNH